MTNLPTINLKCSLKGISQNKTEWKDIDTSAETSNSGSTNQNALSGSGSEIWTVRIFR